METEVEALKWLETNRNKWPFASNKFPTKEDAIQAVKTLYRTGAELVNVAEIYAEEWRIAEEGGPYAATLIVKVGPEAEKQVKEAIEGLGPDEFDKLQKGVYRVWWD